MGKSMILKTVEGKGIVFLRGQKCAWGFMFTRKTTGGRCGLNGVERCCRSECSLRIRRLP